MAAKVSVAGGLSGYVIRRVVVTFVQLPDEDSEMPTCSPVAYGLDHMVTVTLVSVYEVSTRMPYGGR